MSEISSSIKITDEFSAPLKELAKASWNVEGAAVAVSKALSEQGELFNEVADEAKSLVTNIQDSIVPAYNQFAGSINNLGNAFTNMRNDASFETFKELAVAFADATKQGYELGKAIKEEKDGFDLLHKTIRNLPWNLMYKTAMGAFNRLKEQGINAFNALKDSINQSLDEITVSEKLEAMWGDAGRVAKQRAYELANEIGESATMVTELAAKAAYEGIGTDQFDKMMRLADKVSKLKPGETVESAATTLMSDLKSGHSASTISQMFGGGEVMERQLKRAGYERALNRGDVDKALEIAEKIAEQAGLTNEKYNDAYSNMSQNFKRIFNVIDNVKKRLGETFNRSFAPTVEKVKNFVTSEKFQTVVNIFDKIVGLAGKILNFFAEGIIDNIEVMGILLGVAGVAKFVLIIRHVKALIGMSKVALTVVRLFRGPLGWIIGGMGRMIKHLIAIGAKQSLIYLKSKAMSMLKVAGPWMLVGAAIGIALKVLHSLFGEGKSFKEFLMGGIAAAFQLLVNVFQNIFTFFGNLIDKVHVIFLETKKVAIGMKQVFMQNIGMLLQWILDKIMAFLDKTGLAEILSAVGLDVGSAAKTASEWIGDLGKEETERLEAISKQIEAIKAKEVEYISVMNGVKEAYESNGETVKTMLKGLFKSNEKQEKAQDGIAGDTGKIRKFNEQEEELSWMKAFSDRQITSSYNSMTSNVRNININGMSQAGMLEVGRRSLSTMPSRSSM